MAGEMNIDDYLAAGGRLTNPANVPARYRAELMKMMATFVDSELAGAAGFADVVNQGPGIKERIAAARIVMEKTGCAGKVLRLMGEFGANTGRYANHHPWTDRLARDTAPGTRRSSHDMRLSVLNYPLEGWVDAVTMNLAMGLGVCVQIEEMAQVSYQPLADALKEVLPVESRHAALAEKGLVRMMAEGGGEEVRASLGYWEPRVAATFGKIDDDRLGQLRAQGLRRENGDVLEQRWRQRLDEALARVGIKG